MAEPNTTKHALANALKELLTETSFAKITITDICARYGMNRKSFYYHFKDKYDLVNWIFDSEFTIAAAQSAYHTTQSTWYKLRVIIEYFYAHHGFYRKVLSIRGQNSFSEHFRELLFRTVSQQLEDVFPTPKAQEFQTNFITDALVMAVQRWLTAKDPMPPQEFMEQCGVGMRYFTSRVVELETELHTELNRLPPHS